MIELLYFGSIFCALLNVYLLLFSRDALRSYTNYIFSFILLLEVFFVITYLLVYSGEIRHFPHVFKVAAPFNFLIPPLAYLYVKSILHNKNKFSLKDLAHFIPFMMVAFNYAPFYLLPTDDKMVIIQKVSESLVFGFRYQAGFLGEDYLFYLKVLQTLIYLIFQWKLIFSFKKNFSLQQAPVQVYQVLRWVKVFTYVFSSILLGFLFLSLLFSVEPTNQIFQIIKLTQGGILSISFFILSSYILVNPSILTGLPFLKNYASGSNSPIQAENQKFSLDEYQPEIDRIENYMISSKAFLNSDLTLAQVAVNIELSPRELSYIINSHYGTRFTEFVNKYRIEYFTQLLDQGKIDSFTIEALIKSSGFTSKSSFHTAFKKRFNCTPSQYISSQKAFLSR